mgnify:CR=1 FL=1
MVLPFLSCYVFAQQDAEIGSIVAELGERLDAVESENAQLRELVDACSQGKEYTRDWSIDFAGRIHVDYWAFPGDSPGVNAFESGDPTISPQDRLELRRARFASFGDLPGDMIYKLDFELSEAEIKALDALDEGRRTGPDPYNFNF